ncbi:copper chaperone PCu(A)C [Glycomyces albidus]|uniref:Copper chaperone PCu(A)C n=1 Tax=Glycomyces albidus TaxID=2656774 RepID=A0A6L5GE72_9ACTN|nr:copper chaperone PCu(A)C [Glycomyces albidus]MQM27997.1 copper chaperone PCu(A)C [Glycomyces albidus]
MERRDAIAAAGRYGAPLFAAALALAVTGCGAGQDAQTSKMETAISGVDVDAGDLALRDLQIDFGDSGSYPEGGQAPLRVWIANDGDEAVILESVTSPDAEAVTLANETAPEPEPETPVEETPGEASPSPGEGGESPTADATATPDAAESPEGETTATESPAGEGEATAGAAGEREFTVEIPAGDYVRLSPSSGSFLLLEGLQDDLAMGSTVDLEFTFSNGEVVEVAIPMGNSEESGERSYFGDPHEPAAE